MEITCEFISKSDNLSYLHMVILSIGNIKLLISAARMHSPPEP